MSTTDSDYARLAAQHDRQATTSAIATMSPVRYSLATYRHHNDQCARHEALAAADRERGMVLRAREMDACAQLHRFKAQMTAAWLRSQGVDPNEAYQQQATFLDRVAA